MMEHCDHYHHYHHCHPDCNRHEYHHCGHWNGECINSRGFAPYQTPYGTAVKHGFCGSEKQWLRSLRGRRGAPGCPGDKVVRIGDEWLNEYLV